MLYEFKCSKCGAISEHDRELGDTSGEDLTCPKCKSKGLEKVFSKPMLGGSRQEGSDGDSSASSCSTCSPCSSCATCGA